jgi:transposase
MTDANKIAVYEAWKNGQSKASLALQNDVSSRTISRWIDAVEESGYETPKPVVNFNAEIDDSAKVKDVRYLDAYRIKQRDGVTTGELADEFGVSESTIRRWVKRAADEWAVDVSVLGEAGLTRGSVVYQEIDLTKDAVEYNYVASSKSISITEVTNGKSTGSVSADRTTPGFDELLDSLIDSSFSQEALESVYVALQPVLSLERFTQGKIQIDPKERKIYYVADEDTVPYLVDNSLSKRVIDMVREGNTGVATLLNFMEKLMENPSRRAVNELYGFLQANDIVIAEDGDFYAWKKVRNDYFDIHSGTMDNSPGNRLRVARNMVDEDSNRTCSYGLHVCSKSYLPCFGGGSDSARVLKVKVNPADVVAVPADYHNAKMRTAGYTVLEDVTNAHYGSEVTTDSDDDWS